MLWRRIFQNFHILAVFLNQGFKTSKKFLKFPKNAQQAQFHFKFWVVSMHGIDLLAWSARSIQCTASLQTKKRKVMDCKFFQKTSVLKCLPGSDTSPWRSTGPDCSEYSRLLVSSGIILSLGKLWQHERWRAGPKDLKIERRFTWYKMANCWGYPVQNSN